MNSSRMLRWVVAEDPLQPLRIADRFQLAH